jgi:CHAT domain-containing protein/Tfp pilus assembly protein PilF
VETVRRLLEPAVKPDAAPQEALDASERALAAAREARDAPGEAAAQQVRGVSLERLGRREDAVAAYREAAAAWERAGDGPGEIEALGAAARLLIPQREAEARELVGRLAALARTEQRRPRAAAAALNATGVQLYRAGRPQHTLALQRAAVEILEKAAPDTLELAGLLFNLGSVEYLLGNRPAGKALYARSLALREKLAPDSLAVAASLERMSSVAFEEGDRPAARRHLERALAIQEKLAPGSLAAAATLDGLGVLAAAGGDMASARGHVERALEIRERLAPGSLELARSLEQMGGLAQHDGDLAAARDWLQRAVEIREKLAPGSPGLAGSFNALGLLASDLGDVEAARSYYGRALEIVAKTAPNSLQHVQSLSNLGTTAIRLADWKSAAGYLEQALRQCERLAPGSMTEAGLHHNLGVVAAGLGDPKAGEERHLRALAIRERQAPGSAEVAVSLTNLGLVSRQQGKVEEAVGYLRRAAALQERIAPGSMTAAAVLHSLSLTLAVRGELAEAEAVASRAWSLVRSQAEAVTGDEARLAFSASTADWAGNLIGLQAARGRAAAAIATLEESRAQALQYALAERRISEQLGDPKLWEKLRSEKAARNRAEQAAAAASAGEARARKAVEDAEARQAPAGELEKLRSAHAAAAAQLEKTGSAYTEARLAAERTWAEIRKSAPRAYPPAVPLAELRRSLPADQLFVAFAVGEDRGSVLLLRGGRQPLTAAYPLSIPAQELYAQSERLAAAAAGRRLECAAAGRELFRRLFPEPARRAVLEAKRLLISPDGPLWSVPFAALVPNGTGPPQYLGAARAITYTPSLSLYAQARREPRRRVGGPPSALVVGDPVFTRGGTAAASADTGPGAGQRSLLFVDGKPPAPLPAGREEASAVARLYGGAPLLGSAATEDALRRRIGSADVVHLATHGYLHPHRPMSSGMLLAVPAGAGRPAENAGDRSAESAGDGALLAWEIMSQLKLRAELVVLAACESGRGENVRGEGIVGLTRALQYAGARSIVASQWRVSDTGTRALMVAMHRNLRAGMAKDEALRRAMAAVRADPKTAHPYYWAPFFLIGDPGNANLGAGAAKKYLGNGAVLPCEEPVEFVEHGFAIQELAAAGLLQTYRYLLPHIAERFLSSALLSLHQA